MEKRKLWESFGFAAALCARDTTGAFTGALTGEKSALFTPCSCAGPVSGGK
jgi:hypothetical protein